MIPVPVAVQLDPADAEQLHEVTVNRRAPGRVSVSVAFVTAFGPLFVTTIVYVTSSVPRATVVRPSLCTVIARSGGDVEISIRTDVDRRNASLAVEVRARHGRVRSCPAVHRRRSRR